MSQHGGQTSAEVAEEAEHERADLAHTLDQLRENLQPKNVVDEVMTHAGVNPESVSQQAWQVVRSNPIAAVLIGIGAAMLLNVGRRSGTVHAKVPVRAADFSGSGTGFRTSGGDARASRPSASDIDHNVSPIRRSNLGPEFDAHISPVNHQSRHAMSSLSVIKHPRSSLSRLFDEQPLVLAAIGVAVGAAVGSALPSTDIESQLMGEASESVRQNASAAARQQLAQIRETAGQTLEQMKATAADHGASVDNLTGLVHHLQEDVKSGASAVRDQASDLRSRA